MKNPLILPVLLVALISCSENQNVGKTEITKWPNNKTGAVSITYDDGTLNQFRNAVPVMDNLGMPGTFFINTGTIKGSEFMGTFIGRPVKEIIKETATVKTDSTNFYERSSAAAYLGLKGTLAYHSSAGSRIDAGNKEKAYQVMDELYLKVRRGEFSLLKGVPYEILDTIDISWDDVRAIASRGHEFASHMVTHPRLAALDEVNAMYELEKSRDEIMNQLGKKHIISAEVPFGSEDKRAIEYAARVYPALRNDMRESYIKEIHRSNRSNPGSPDSEYVQWQRGALKSTPMHLMKSWVDTAAVYKNMWLVLVFHGVDGIGWEALTSKTLDEYFKYIESKDGLWVATFGDAARYIRERINTKISTEKEGKEIRITLTHSLDTGFYNLPLTLKTAVPESWKEVSITQGNSASNVTAVADSTGNFVFYQALPNKDEVILARK